MAKVEFPKPLRELLEDSNLQAPLRALADHAGEILADNKLPFFPDYTDHGTDHINSVLKSEVELVPKQVWENSQKDSDPRLLYDADAAVIIGATLLHDIAMHLRSGGFLELVSGNSRFRPLPWFAERHGGQSADRPWPELWEDFVREARRFSDRALTNIIGEESARTWKFHELPTDTGQWERNHNLIIGEFIRRHHARLAHEIAIYGFPGIPVGSGEGQFPAMGKEEGHPLMRLADLIGLAARSHGLSLRVCKSCLEGSPEYAGTPRPMGTAVLYPMALLRVADYLQIDRQRAPAVLLQLRSPQSPISIQEWKKHRAVQNIGPAVNPRGKMVTVSTDLSFEVYLQLEELLESLQAEMDHSTAVLDEAYGTLAELGLNKLNLNIRRVYSNLHSPAFRDSLPYIPNRTGFTSDPNLLTLLVEPLYGKQPGVGVRELMQNAADAVSELEAWSAARGISVKSLDLPDQDGDVLIDFVERKDGSWFLRVRDRGIGMTSDTIENYFLRAGASFRRSAEWAKEFLNEQDQPIVIRAGRFGIGVFAVFLLGPSFRLWTRHASADKSKSYFIDASANNQLIEVRKVDGLPVGTTVEVELSRDAVKTLRLDEEKYGEAASPESTTDWFCWNWPKVVKRVIRGKKRSRLRQEFSSPIRKVKLPPEWSVFYPRGFDAVYWTFASAPTLACNGLRIEDPEEHHRYTEYFDWPPETRLRQPNVAVLDSAANLPLTIQRYELSNRDLPFIAELTRDVTLSFIAHALVCGPTSRTEALSLSAKYPLRIETDWGLSDHFSPTAGFSGFLHWCETSAQMVPADPWLYSLLNTDSCLVYGAIATNPYANSPVLPKGSEVLIDHATGPHSTFVKSFPGRISVGSENLRWVPSALIRLATEGVLGLGHKVETSRVLVSVSTEAKWFPGVKTLFHAWKTVPDDNFRRTYLEITRGSPPTKLPLMHMLRAIESPSLFQDTLSTIAYVSELKTKRVKRAPASLIARIWNECLGPRAIPFELGARLDLIKDGCRHPELRRHIEAWQEMKRNGSKWATGG